MAKPQGKVFSIVHGWDRDWDVKSLFEFRYRFAGDFDLTEFKKWNAETVKNLPVPRRALRRLDAQAANSGRDLSLPPRVFKRNP